VEFITTLSDVFKEEFSFDREVAINNPFSGGFISNAHFWHKGIPWIQIEINRSLYEPDGSSVHPPTESDDQVIRLREKIWNVLTTFWNRVG
jgi:formiminoglutamase